MIPPFEPCWNTISSRWATKSPPLRAERIFAASPKADLALLDVMLPGMDGLEVLRRLYREQLPDRLPIFLITAEASDSVLREAYSLGVMDVISKPVVPYVVHRRVKSVIELFQARRRLSRTVESPAGAPAPPGGGDH